MESNFHDGDYLLIDEISYRFHEPERGEVIVFRFPQDESQFFIKRIVGLPGETVQVKNNTVTIFNGAYPQGMTLNEAYLDQHQLTTGETTTTLGPDQYYVLGDNRLQSADSRRWGPVPKIDIIGRVMLRAWPFSQFSTIEDVTY